MTAKIVKSVADDGTVTHTESDTTITDVIIGGITAPLEVFSSGESDEFIDKKSAAWQMIGGVLVGMEVGYRYGMAPSRILSL